MSAVLSWWVIAQILGLAAMPLAWRMFAFLPSRGYALAKALGLLFVSYFLWLGASFRLLPNSLGGVLFAFALFAGLSCYLGRGGLSRDPMVPHERPLFRWIRQNWRVIVAGEVLFLLVLAGWTTFRAFNPDIAGTEKPMELAFLNGVLGSRFFPPQDPWLSGYGISYYYFGYVMLGVMTRLSGMSPAVAFNLGVALWFSLTAVGAFGLVYDLVQLASPRETGSMRWTRPAGRGIRYGLLGALFVGLLGNLEGLVELAYHQRLIPLAWIQWLDIKQLTDSPPSGNLTGGFWWWWHASRVIHDKDLLGNSVEVIDEFPFFSFLLGDMHPHVLALPFVLLAIGLCLSLLLAAKNLAAKGGSSIPGGALEDQPARRFSLAGLFGLLRSLTGMGTAGLLIYAVILGALAFLNTWDFPIYAGLVALSVGAGLAMIRGLSWAVVSRALASGAVFAVLGWLCYLPFYTGFQSQFGGILPNLFFPSRLSQFIVMFGTLLWVVLLYLILLSRPERVGRPDDSERNADPAPLTTGRSRSLGNRLLHLLPFVALIPVALGVVFGLIAVLHPQGRILVQTLLNDPGVQANITTRTIPHLALLAARIRIGNPWTYLALAGLISWTLALVWARLFPSRGPEPAVQRTQADGGRTDALSQAGRTQDATTTVDLFALLMIGVALALALGVEFFYLRDLFGTRMNTVFKFYYQAWLLLGLASAYGLSRLAARSSPAPLRWTALTVTTLLVAGGLFYSAAAIPSKADNFRGTPTLDGLAYLRRSSPGDAAAVEWIRANLPTSAVVLEAAGGSYSPEGAGRVSMATGNPTLLGWDFHEMQWRGSAYQRLTAGRPDAITQIYRTARSEELVGLMDRWGIDYVYVGALERNKYGIGDAVLSRFDRTLNRVYDAGGVVIYGR